MESSQGVWKFHYDEDGFLIAENNAFGEDVCRAVSDFVDEVRSLRFADELVEEWEEIKRNYPQDPTGVAFNATQAELVDGGKVIIESLYGQFSAVELSEKEFSRVIREFRDFLRVQAGK